MRNVIYILFLVFASTMAQGQNALQKTMQFYQDKQLDSAKHYSDLSVENEALASQAYTWHVRGFVYKDIYTKKDDFDRESPAREKAIEAFFTSIELDSTDKFKENNVKSIKYLADQYWNDAARTLNAKEYEVAEKSYKRYKELHLKLNPNKKFNNREIKFLNALAAVYSAIYESNKEKHEAFQEKSIETYKEVLELDTNNYLANYNVGILYYNQGVDIILELDPTTPLPELIEKEEKCAELFEKSLPYMLKAHKLNSTKKETVNGLIGIYYQLKEKEKSKFYSDMLENMENQNKNDE